MSETALMELIAFILDSHQVVLFIIIFVISVRGKLYWDVLNKSKVK